MPARRRRGATGGDTADRSGATSVEACGFRLRIVKVREVVERLACRGNNCVGLSVLNNVVGGHEAKSPLKARDEPSRRRACLTMQCANLRRVSLGEHLESASRARRLSLDSYGRRLSLLLEVSSGRATRIAFRRHCPTQCDSWPTRHLFLLISEDANWVSGAAGSSWNSERRGEEQKLACSITIHGFCEGLRIGVVEKTEPHSDKADLVERQWDGWES